MLRTSLAGLALVLLASLPVAGPARAGSDEAFFTKVYGQWSGPGEIVAGKYKGTKFTCDFAGLQQAKTVGVDLDGSCRVGLFSQEMKAAITRNGASYKGAFQDGAKGRGLDIVSGAVDGQKIVVGLDRKQLKGAMVARLTEEDTLAITVSVRVGSELVPVLGMNLKRDGETPRRSAEAK